MATLSTLFAFHYQACLLGATADPVSVLVFGDSYGDTGPTYHQLQDTLDAHEVKAVVRSAAIGGTAACWWASQDNGMALVNKARDLFPSLVDGPEYLWYTAGANDVWQNRAFKDCQKKAKSWKALSSCIVALKEDVKSCTTALLENYWKAFPKSKVLHTGYDIPCYSLNCRLTFDSPFFVEYCGSNVTCANTMGRTYEELYIGDLTAKYHQPQYTGLHFIGASQKAWGVKGADVGAPVMTEGSNCRWVTECVHPTYNSPAGKAWGSAFWDKYFSRQISGNKTIAV